MRIFTYGETPPQIPSQPDQEPISFKAVPYYTGRKQQDDLSLADEMLANKDKFPLIEDVELVFIDGRQNPPAKSLGSDIMVHFVDRAKNQRIMYWDMYSVDKREPEDLKPLPDPGKLIDAIEMDYLIVMTADEYFIYIAFTKDESAADSNSSVLPTYERYCKIPKDRFESEWKEFVDWYHAHPEKRKPAETSQLVAPRSNVSQRPAQRRSWLSKFFK